MTVREVETSVLDERGIESYHLVASVANIYPRVAKRIKPFVRVEVHIQEHLDSDDPTSWFDVTDRAALAEVLTLVADELRSRGDG